MAAIPAAGDTAVVIGQGLIGSLGTRWLLRHGVRVVVTDLVLERLERAHRWGVVDAVNGREADAEARIRTSIGHGADIVVEASGSTHGALWLGVCCAQSSSARGRPGPLVSSCVNP